MWNNVPDDWGNYYVTCPECGFKYHASEGGCDCEADLQEPDNKDNYGDN